MHYFTWIASHDHFGHFHRLSSGRFTVSITDSDIYTFILLNFKSARVRKGTYTSTILVCFPMSIYVPSNQKVLGSTPAIHTFPIQVVFLPGMCRLTSTSDLDNWLFTHPKDRLVLKACWRTLIYRWSIVFTNQSIGIMGCMGWPDIASMRQF